MCDILIVTSYSSMVRSTKPAGAYTLANVLRSKGYLVEVLDYTFVMSAANRREFLTSIASERLKLVMISTTLMGERGDALPSQERLNQLIEMLVSEVREVAPQVRFAAGGSYVNAKRPITPRVEFRVEGQGEYSALALAAHVFFDHPLEVVEANGQKTVTDKVYANNTFNVRPALTFTAQDRVMKNETLPIEMGRGCVFRCSYCMYDLLGKNFEDFVKPKEALYSALMYNYDQHGTTNYVIIDDTINDSIEKARMLADVVQRLPFKFQFGGYMRLELFHKYPEMAELYRIAGLRAPVFGVETFNKKAGALVGKGFGEKAKDVLNFLRNAWGQDVVIGVNLIVGLPHDTKEHLLKQHQWFLDSKWEGNISHNPMALDKAGLSNLLTDKSCADWFKLEPTRDEAMLHRWTSPEFTSETVKEFSEELRQDWLARSPSLLGAYDGFSIMAMLQFTSIETMRLRPAKGFSVWNAQMQYMKNARYMERLTKPNRILETVPMEEEYAPTGATYHARITSKHTNSRGIKSIPIQQVTGHTESNATPDTTI